MISFEIFIKQILPTTLKHEGGYANIPGDNGGETYRGISKRSNPDWEGWPILNSLKPLRNGDILNNVALNTAVANVYWKKYFQAKSFHLLDSLSNAINLFDFAVLGGYSGTKIQQLLNEKFNKNLIVDGVVGAKTIAAINSVPSYDFSNAVIELRKSFVSSIVANNPSQIKFKNGWLNRLNNLKDQLTKPISIVAVVAILGFFF